jgi:hypothetical protein
MNSEKIYALYYEYADERHYFYVGRTNDPQRRMLEHRRAVKNKKHTEDVYCFIREKCEPQGIPVWDMEVLVTEETARPEDCEDFWVVLMIRAGHDLKNMKHGDLHKVALEIMAKQRPDLDFATVDEFIEFRETVEREQREAYERSERLKREVLGEDEGNPQILEWVRNNAEAFREKNAANAARRKKKEERERAKALEKDAWLRSLRKPE